MNENPRIEEREAVTEPRQLCTLGHHTVRWTPLVSDCRFLLRFAAGTRSGETHSWGKDRKSPHEVSAKREQVINRNQQKVFSTNITG